MRRLAPWAISGALAAVIEVLVPGDGGDGWMFVSAGRTLLSHDWAHAFSDSGVQVGPLQLALFGSVGRSRVALAIVLGVAAALLLLAAARSVGVRRPRTLTGLGLAAVAAGFTLTGFASGHPADSLIPLIWILAAAQAGRGRLVHAGLMVGLASGIETWAILGIATFALAPSLRDAARGSLVAATSAVLLFLPFVLAGHFAMGDYAWRVSSQSVLQLVVAPGTRFGWSLRIVQGALSIAAGMTAARRARLSPHALWLAAFTVAATRLLLDPVDSDYYFAALEGPALVGASLLAARGLPFGGLRRESLA